MVKFCNEMDLKEKDTLNAGQRCAWCQAPADQLCQSGLIFCGVECRAESLKHGFKFTYLAALKAPDRITTFSCGRFEVPLRNAPWVVCDRYALYHRRDELFEKMLSAGFSTKSMLVLTASSSALLVCSFAVDDVRERKIVTETAMHRMVSLLHLTGLEMLHDEEKELEKRTDEAMLFAVLGMVKAGRGEWRVHADSIVLRRKKHDEMDALQAESASTEYAARRNVIDGRFDVDIRTVQPSLDYFVHTGKIARDLLIEDAGGEVPPGTRLGYRGKEPRVGRCLFESRRVV